MDGRYGFGNPNRYTGGWATANGVTSDTNCRLTCRAQPECTLLTVTKEECQDAKDTLGMDGSNGDSFEQTDAIVKTQVPNGCSHYTDPGSMSYSRVQWNPGLNGQDNVKDTLSSTCTSTAHWCYRSYNRRICKKHDKLKKRFKILESTSQKCSDILRLPSNKEVYDSGISMPGLNRWAPTRNNMSYAFNYKDRYVDEKDYIQIGDTPHTLYASHVQNFDSLPSWDTQTDAQKALVLLPVPCDGCAAGKYSTVGESTCKDCPMGKTNAANMYSCLDCLPGQYSALGEDKCTLCEDPEEISLVFHYFEGESDNTVTEDECSKMGEYDGTTTDAARPTGCYIYTANGHFIYNLATSGVACSSSYGCVGRSRKKYEVLTHGFPMTEYYEIVATNQAVDETMTSAECRELYDAHPGPKNSYCLSTDACNTNKPRGCARLWTEGQWYFYHTSSAGYTTCTPGYRCYRKNTNFGTPDSTECQSSAYDLGKNWIGTGSGQEVFPGCIVYSNGNIAHLENTATQESHENHIVGYEWVRKGECAGTGSSNVNTGVQVTCTGDGFDCIEKCYKECKRRYDEGTYASTGFVVYKPTSNSNENCWCEAGNTGRDCTWTNNDWHRYDFIYKGLQPTLATAAVSKTCGRTCPTGSFRYGTVCAPCRPGNYCPGDNSIKPCPAGKFSYGYNATECQSCVPGKYSTAGWATCNKCARGKYSGYKLVHDGRPDKSVGYHLCKSYGGTSEAESWFPAKEFQEVDDVNKPQGCYVDMTASDTKIRWNRNFGNKVCSPMFPCVQRMTTCENCPVGRWSDIGYDECLKIPDGRYGVTLNPDWTGSYGWSQCGNGKYKKVWRKVVSGSNDGTVTYDDCKAVATELGYTWGGVFSPHQLKDYGDLSSATMPGHSCAGDCDYDSDCAGNMKCYQRHYDYSYVPGCGTGGVATHDWCYIPSTTLTTSVVDGTTSIPLCYGDCDHDSDCVGDSVCYQRPVDSSPSPPGCAGLPRQSWDYCVSPQSYTNVGLKQPAEVGTFDSSLFVNPKGCIMLKGVSNTIYYNIQDSPATCNEDRPCIQYTTGCTKCGSGKYATGAATACQNCAAGKYSQNGASSCTDCAAGTYDSADWGRHYVATTTPSNSWNGLGEGNGLSYDDCKIYAQQNSLTFHEFYTSTGGIYGCFTETGHVYYNPDGNKGASSNSRYQLLSYYDVCTSCAAGQITPSPGSSSCQACSSGTYQENIGQTGCKACNPGKYQNQQGQSSCKDCAPGWYSHNYGMATCNICGAGKKQSSNPPTSCTDCSPGYYQNNQGQTGCKGCAGGKYQNEQAATIECKDCPPGKSQVNSYMASCDDCSPGYYQNNPRQEACWGCTPGRYQDESSKTECKYCPVGKAVGQSYTTDCDTCGPGYYQNEQAQTQCKGCIPGQHQNENGQSGCKACPAGKATQAYYQANCGNCGAGQFQDWTGQTACKVCPVGKSQAYSGQGICNLCGVGQYQNEQGQVSCKQCIPGQHQDQHTQTDCKICGYGQYQEQSSQSLCKYCPAGKYGYLKSAGLASHCKDCPEGRYSSSTVPSGGATEYMTQAECTELYNAHPGPKNSYCLNTNICNSARPIGCSKLWVEGQWYFYHTTTAGLATCQGSYTCYKREAFRSCKACPNGKTADAGSSACTLCPANTHTPHSIGAIGMYNRDYHLSVSEEQCISLAVSMAYYQTTGPPDLSMSKDDCRHFALINNLVWYSDSYSYATEPKGCWYYTPNEYIYYNNGGSTSYHCSSTFQCIQNNGLSYIDITATTNDCQYGCSVTGTASTYGSGWVSWCGNKHATNSYSLFTNRRLVTSSPTCVTCPNGKEANAERTECVTCAAGKVSVSGTCTQCASGKYAAEINVVRNTSSFNLDTVNRKDCETYANAYGDSFNVGVWDNYPYGCTGYYSDGHINHFYWNDKLAEVVVSTETYVWYFRLRKLEECKRSVNYLSAAYNVQYIFKGVKSDTSRPSFCYVENSVDVYFNTNGGVSCDSTFPCIHYNTNDRVTGVSIPVQYSNKCIGCQPGQEAKSDGTGCNDCDTGEYSMEYIMSSTECEEAHNQLKDDTGQLLFAGYTYFPGGMNTISRRDLPRGCQYLWGHNYHGIVFNTYEASWEATTWYYTSGSDSYRCNDGNTANGYEYIYNAGRHTGNNLCGNSWCCRRKIAEDLFQVNVNNGAVFTYYGASRDTRYGVINIDGVVENDLTTNGDAKWTIMEMASTRVCPMYQPYDYGDIRYHVKYIPGEQCRTTSTCKACPAGMYKFEPDYSLDRQHYDGWNRWNINVGNNRYNSLHNSISYNVEECKAYADANGITFHLLSDTSKTSGCGFQDTSFIYYNVLYIWWWDSPTQDSLVHWSRCIICAPGSFQSADGQTSCTFCEAGKYQNQQGQTSGCKDCPEALVQPLTGQGSCESCPVGKEKISASQACANCPIGRYQDETSSSNNLWLTCKHCGPGAYQDEQGKTSCKACESGKTHESAYGATSDVVCYKCDPGKYSIDYTVRYHQDNAANTLSVDSTECQALASAAGYSFTTGCNRNYNFPGGCSKNSAGSYFEYNTCSGQYCNTHWMFSCVSKNFKSATLCQTCEAGKFQDEEGQTSCKDCVGNSWSHSSRTYCESCSVGRYTYNVNADSGVCFECQTGQYQNEKGQTGCKNCPAGQYQDSYLSTSCHNCNAGTYQDLNGQYSCKNCPIYHYQDAVGQDHCHMCNTYQYNMLPGMTSCFPCSSSIRSGHNQCDSAHQCWRYIAEMWFCPAPTSHAHYCYYSDNMNNIYECRHATGRPDYP